MRGQPAQTLKPDRTLYAILIFLAIAAAIYFRFVNLRQSPSWYSDEGNHIDLAENWMQGKWQNYGVIGATERLPLYMYTLSFAMRIFGVDISVSRGLSATASLICVFLISWIAWQKLGKKVGLLAGWVIAIAPWIVTFGRFGLDYNLMAPFFLFSLIAIYFYCLKPSPGWLFAASVTAALAFATDYLGIICGVTIGLTLAFKRPRAFGWFVFLFLITLSLVVLPLLLEHGHIFFTQISTVFFSHGGAQATPISLLTILINYSELLRRQSWILIGLCGLFLIKDKLLRSIFLTAVGLTLLIVTRTYVPKGVMLHYLMHIFPLFALGLAIFLLHAYEFLKNLFNGQLTTILNRFPKYSGPLSGLSAALIVFSPLLWMFLGSFAITTYNTNFLFTGDDDLHLVDVQNADQVRAYVTTHITANDLILGSPALIWGLPTMHRADFLTAIYYSNLKPQDNTINPRFTNDLSLHKARFIILDPLAEELAPKVVPGMDIWLEKIHQWPVLFEAGQIKVYANGN